MADSDSSDKEEDSGYIWHLSHKKYRWLTITNLALATQNFFEKQETKEEKRPIIVRCIGHDLKVSDYNEYIVRWLSVSDVKLFAVAGMTESCDGHVFYSWADEYCAQKTNESKNDLSTRISNIQAKLVYFNEKEFENVHESRSGILSSTSIDTHIDYHCALDTMKF